MPTVEGLELAYALHELPPGRLPFARWRWELWHGTTLIAAGWRVGRRDAGRALRLHAADFGHRLFGLPVPARDRDAVHGDLRPGAVERLVVGPIACVLRPRALEASPGLPALR